MSTKSRILVIGADSVLGSALMAGYELAGHEVAGTTRRQVADAGDGSLFRLDLAGPLDDWRPPASVDAAFFCAGITRLAACRANPEFSSKINVESTLAAAQKLAEAGAFLVFFSSPQAFSGNKPYPKPDTPPAPATEYGRQKARLEQEVLGAGWDAAILRLTKILGPNVILGDWAKCLLEGRPIRPYSNMSFAPITLEHAATCIRRAADRRLAGVWHVSADQDVTYARAAVIGAEELGADPSLVRPVECVEEDGGEAPQLHTALDTSLTCEALGVETPKAEDAIREFFRGHRPSDD